MPTNEEPVNEVECESCTELRNELDRVLHREAWVWERVRGEIVRLNQCETALRQVSMDRDTAWQVAQEYANQAPTPE